MSQAIDTAAGDLRGRADWIAGCRHTPENARVGAQHALAEKLLTAMPSARQ